MNEPVNPLLQYSASLPKSLHHVLVDLNRQPYPHVPNPQSCKKRASVALILRVRPTYDHWPKTPYTPRSQGLSTGENLDSFFSQEWVQHGEPEVLFIKRATRTGDRWTGHVALPGGKRDPEDLDDSAAAIREASEEIGLDLTTEDCIPVGNLPERVVTTSWGAVPLMVLCPFVFLWTRSDSPNLRLQPAEVASTHWVPLRTLLSPASRTAEYVDLTDRYVKRAGYLARVVCRSIMGFMQFSAVRLDPTESLCCNTVPGFFPDDSETNSPTLFQQWNTWCWGRKADSQRPLHLWGLTLGILADLLDMLPPHNAVLLWKYPTFTAPDLRFIVSILTHRLRKRNLLKATRGVKPNNTALDGQTAALSVPEPADSSHDDNQVGIGGLGAGPYHKRSTKDAEGSSYAVGIMLKGYYERVRVAMYVFLAWRVLLGGMSAAYAWRIFRRR